MSNKRETAGETATGNGARVRRYEEKAAQIRMRAKEANEHEANELYLAAQKKAIRQFDGFVAAFDELEMLSSLCPDGSEITFNAGTERERRQIRKMAWMIGNYIKGSCE